ncbi:autotransporter-associated beta strand repeat-containing protein [bacterium]|nr:autotransporter-associated beta strand repeat-containing protein [bacterium]
MSKNARSRLWTRCFSRKPAPELPVAGLRFEQLEDRLAPATFTWTGAGANANWSTPGNWQGGVAPSGAAIDLVFPAGAQRPANVNDLATGTGINKITVQGTGAGGFAYRISESPDATVNSIVLSGSIEVAPNSAEVIFELPTTFATNGDQSLTVDGNGSILTLTAPLTAPAANNLNKDGVGRLVLAAASPNLLGGVKVNSGILEIRHVLALGPAGGTETVVSTNAGLYLGNVVTVPGGQTSVGEQVRLNGGGFDPVQGALYNESGNTVWSGPVILETGITSPPQAGGPGTVIGAAATTQLNITGVISDSGAGMGLVKEGAGEVKLGSPTGNTYRGQTNVNLGVLTVTHALSLGDSRPTTIQNGFPANDPRARPQPGNFGTITGAFQNPTSGTVVNVSPTGSGQLRLEAPAGSPGFTIVGEYLVLNGAANFNSNAGAIFNTRGDNDWAGSVILGSSSPDGADVAIGVGPAGANPSSLTISGIVDDPNRPSAVLTKNGTGRLILTAANTYRGTTNIREGTITIRDSQGLGPAGGAGGTFVRNGAALELDVEAAYDDAVAPRYNQLGRDTWADSVTNDAQRLTVNEILTVNGRGLGAVPNTGVAPGLSTGGTGALRSMTGINQWISPITLDPGASEVAIGVEPDGSVPAVNGVVTKRAGHPTPDSSYFRSDYSLTIVSTVTGGRATDFVKRGTGHLILPNANPYFGRTLIEQGWVTVQNSRSLGDSTPATSFGETAQQPTVVSDGAALHLMAPAPGVQIVLDEEYLATPTPAQGAGIGVERAAVVESPVGSGTFVLLPSSLILNGELSDGIRYQQSQSGSFTAANVTSTFTYDAGAVSGRITVPYDFGTVGDRLQILYGGNTIFDTGGFVTGIGLATVNFGPGATTALTVVVTSGGGTPAAPNGWSIGAQSIGATPRGIVTQFPSSFVKLGSQTLTLLGAGSQSGGTQVVRVNNQDVELGGNEVREGTLRLQNDTALGRATTGTEITRQTYDPTRTVVANGARLELAGSVAMHEGGVAAGVQVNDERLVLNEYGVQIRVTGQPTARFQLDFAGQRSGQIEVPATNSSATVATQIQNAINNELTSIAASLVAGIPGAVPADARATVVAVGPGVFAITFGAARFNNLNISALTAFIVPVGTIIQPIVDPMNPATVAALAEVRISGTNAPLVSLSDDNTWRGPVTLNRGTRIEVRPNSRLSFLGDVTDAANSDAAGSDLVKRDAGDLTLGGAASSFRGTTWIDEGIVTAVSSRAFGDVTGGTVVASGAQLQIQGSLTIAGESLSVAGNGTSTLPALDATLRWLNVGPGATNNGVAPPYTPEGAPTSARINSIATDPTDPRVIYVATAGGGAWKTKDGGLTWIALFDLGVESATNNPLSPPTDATANGAGMLPMSAMMFGGQIAVAPSNPSVVYYATGDSNGVYTGLPNTGQFLNQADNYAGSGVYRSDDSGKTWTRLLNPDKSNPLYGQAVTKMIVDPLDATRVYLASSTVRALVSTGAGVVITPANLGNATLNAATRAGVWRFTPADSWVNLTAQTSARRLTTVGSAPYDTAAPGNAGPDDDYRVRFPTGAAGNAAEAATWSDIQLVTRGNTPGPNGVMQYTLYAALGESTQTYFGGVGAQAIRNAVYRTDDPERSISSPTAAGPTWWLGRGTLYPLETPGRAQPITPPDARGGEFDVGPITPPVPANPPFPGKYGYIKIAAASTQDEIFVNGLRDRYAVVNWYAAGLWRDFLGTDGNLRPAANDPLRGELRDLMRSQTNADQSSQAGWAWTTIAAPTLPFGAATQSNGANVRPATGRYNFVLAVRDYDPRVIGDNNPDELYFGGLDSVFVTTTATTTPAWTAIGADDRGFAPAEQYHALTFDASNRLLMGSDGGLWRWDRFRFSNLNSNLPAVQLNSADPNPTDFRQAVGGSTGTGTQVWNGNTPDGTTGVWKRTDDASLTPTTGVSGSVSGVVRYDPFNPSTIYAVRDGALRKSTNGGQSWTQLTPAAQEFGTTGFTGGNGAPFPNRYRFNNSSLASLAMFAYDQFPMVVDPLTPNRVLVGGLTFNPDPLVDNAVARLYESTNGGTSWVSLNVPIQPTAIALAGFQGPFVPDPRFPTVTEGLANTPDPRTIYVTNGTTISVTKNRGVSWAGALGNLVVPAGGTIMDLVVNPVNRDEVYAVVSAGPGVAGGRVWRSLNAGQTWTNLTGVTDPDTNDASVGPLPSIPVWKAAIDPRSGNLYVGTDNGVWVLVDPAAADPTNLARTAGAGTVYWRRLGDGMPNVQVRDLVLNQTTSILTAATYGRGMFQLFLPDYAATSGALRAVSGTSRWTGPVTLTGDTRIGTVGTQQIQNGLNAASLDLGGTISGAFSIEKVGQGTLILSAANTYTGQTVVTQGVLEVKNPTALGAPTGNTVVQYGAALQVRSDIEAEPITINGDGIYFNGRPTGALRNISGNNVYNGVLTLGTGTFAAAPQPPDADPAQVTIGVDSGSSLRIGQNTAGPNPGLIGRVRSLAASSQGIDKELPGTLILSSDNTNYLGFTEVIAGAVEVRNGQALGPIGTGLGTLVRDGAAVRIANATPGTPTVVEDEVLTLSGTGTPDGPGGLGTGALRNTGGDNTWGGPIALDIVPGTNPPTNPGAQIAFGVSNSVDVLTVRAAGGITENAAAAQFGLIKVGPGILRLEEANHYTGVTNVNEGTLRVANDDALGTVETSSEVQTIRVFGVGTYRLNLNGQLTTTLTANPAGGSGAAAVAAAIEQLIAGAGPDVLVTETPNANGRVFTVTFRGRFTGQNVPALLAENVSAGVTVTVDTPQPGGLGTVVAAGASLDLDSTGLPSPVTVNETLTLNGAGVTDAGGVRYGALGNHGGNNTYGGTITIGTATTLGAQPGSTLTVTGGVLGQPNDPTVVPDVVTPAAAELTKVGGGTVVFPNDKEYRGRTVVAEGALQIASSGALGVARSETQRVRVTGTFGSTYTISFLGETTDPIPFQFGAAGATELYNALTRMRDGNTLPAMFGAGDVTVTAVVAPAPDAPPLPVGATSRS